MSADLTTAEQSAKRLLDSVRDHRDLLQAQESRLSEVKQKRTELDSFTRIPSLKLAEAVHQHDTQIAVAEIAVSIDKARLKTEMEKSIEVNEQLEAQKEDFKRNADLTNIDNRLYEPEFSRDIYSLTIEAGRL